MDTLRTHIPPKDAVGIIDKILPGPDSPQWYFGFALTCILVYVLGSQWLAKKKRSGGETGAFPSVRLPPPSSANLETRLSTVEKSVADLHVELLNQMMALERTTRASIDENFREMRREEADRANALRETLMAEQARSASRFEVHLEELEVRMLQRIGNIFRQDQDGIRIPGPIPTFENPTGDRT